MFRDKDLYTMPNFRTIEVDSTIASLSDFSQLYAINYKILKQFNPWLRTSMLPDKSRRKYKLKIPVDTDLMVFDDIQVNSDSLK